MRKLVVIVFLCIGIALSIKEGFLKKDKVRSLLMFYNIEALAADYEHIELLVYIYRNYSF